MERQVKRAYFSRSKKQEILQELELGDMTMSELARSHGLSPVSIYRWRRMMKKEEEGLLELGSVRDMQLEIAELKKTVSHLKEITADLALDKKILETYNKVLKKNIRKNELLKQKKSSKS